MASQLRGKLTHLDWKMLLLYTVIKVAAKCSISKTSVR